MEQNTNGDAFVSPEEHAGQAAEEIVHDLKAVGPETRSSVINSVAEKLEPAGVTVVDISTLTGGAFEFDPESLEGVKGKRSQRTRSQVLASMAINNGIRARRSRRPLV